MKKISALRAGCKVSQILHQISQGDYRQLKSKKLWKNRGRVKYIRVALTGACRLVVVMRKDRVLYYWIGTHEEYNNMLPRLRRRNF